MIKNRIFDKNWIFENNQLRIGPRRDLDTPGVREFTSVHSKADWIFIFWILNFGGSKISVSISSNKFQKFSVARNIYFFFEIVFGWSFSYKWIFLFLTKMFSKTVKILVFGSTIFKGCLKGVSNGICMFTYNFISILWFRPMSEFIISVSFRKFRQRILFLVNN